MKKPNDIHRRCLSQGPLFLVPIVIFGIWWGSIRPFIASQVFVRGAYRKSLEYDTFINHESRRFLSQHVLNGEDLLPVDYIVDEMEKNVQEHPLDAKSYIYLGLLYSKNARDKDKAKWAVREARRLAPFRPEVRDMEELCKP